MKNSPATRRRFMAHFAGLGLGSTLLPGVLWGQVNQSGQGRVTAEMLKSALALSGLEFDAEARQAMLRGVNQNLERDEKLREVDIPDDVGPPFHFTALVPGMTVDRTRRPFRPSAVRGLKRPANLEDVAFWPVRHLAELIRTKQVSSVELTQMYLARLHRLNAKLNCVVTFLDDLGLQATMKWLVEQLSRRIGATITLSGEVPDASSARALISQTASRRMELSLCRWPIS